VGPRRARPVRFRSRAILGRPMRLWLFLVGLVLAIVGVFVFGAGLFASGATTTETVTAGTVWHVSASALTSVTATIQWGSSSPVTQVYLVSGAPTCTNPSGKIGSGVGSSGSFSASLKPGVSYSLYACSGGIPQTATFSYTSSGGLTLGEVAGLAMLGPGVILVIWERPRDRTLQALNPQRPARAPRPTPSPTREEIPPDPLAPPPPPPSPVLQAAANGRTLRGCPGCGKFLPIDDSESCPFCGHRF